VICCLTWVTAAQAAPVTLEFTGEIFGVTDDVSDVWLTTAPDTYSLLVTWDPDLLTGMPLPFGPATLFETVPGETSITFSFRSGAGDFFTSDNSFPVRVIVWNTPPQDPNNWMPGHGEDRFHMDGKFASNLTFNLDMVESDLGTNPLSSNDLPTTGFGSGPGTWGTSELDIDRTDMFANISGSVSNIEEVTTVPEPSTLLLFSGACALLAGLTRRRTAVSN
jgi:PEP-CTERM motif